MTSPFDRRLASGLAVAVLVLLVAGGVALLGERPGTATAMPATVAADGHAEPAEHGHGTADMEAIQRAVQTAYCPAPGSEIAGGEPTGTLEVVVTPRAYGSGELRLAAGELVRLRLDNRDSRPHQVGIFHRLRPGCPLALAEAGPGEVAEVNLRLGTGTYVYGDPTHEGERDLLVVEAP